MNYVQQLYTSLVNMYSSTNYVQATLIVVLIFLSILVLSKLRHYIVKSSFQASFIGILIGFVLALIVEGFFLIWGKTLLTETLGWKDAPKPLKTAMELGREKFVSVLGVSSEKQQAVIFSDPKVEDAIDVIQSLDPNENKKIKDIICTP